MAAAGAGGGAPDQQPLQLVDYDVPEVAPTHAWYADVVLEIKRRKPWFRIKPETSVQGEIYILFYFGQQNGIAVRRVGDARQRINNDGTVTWYTQFIRVSNNHGYSVRSDYDAAGNFIEQEFGKVEIYAEKKPVPAEVAAGERGEQYRAALVQAFGPEAAIALLRANIRKNAKERRSHVLAMRMSQGGGRRRTKRQRGGNKLMQFLEAGKAGVIQGLKNAPKATFAQLHSSLKNKGSSYGTPNSIISMRGANINEELANINTQFVKEAGAALRPYTLAARQAVMNKYNSLMGPKGTIPTMKTNYFNKIRKSQYYRNVQKKANNFTRKFTPLSYLPQTEEIVAEAVPELM